MAFIEEDDLYKSYEDARKFALPNFEPFDEFERIARNKPHPGIDKSLPKVTDGTLASLIQETPKRVLQQIPTGNVECDDKYMEIIAGDILHHHILPYANSQADLLQKSWAGVSKSATYGSQGALVQMVSRGDYFGPDFTLPYIKNTLLEPGKVSDRDSNVIFIEAYYQKNQIEQIIAKEDMLTKNSITRGDTESYQSGWDLTVLKELKDNVSQKDPISQTPNEKTKQKNQGFILIVHCFQRGVGAEFYSFSPKMKKVVRRKKNKDPRGAIPVHMMYLNVDLSNPYGRGAVEISGGMQNLLDSEVQSYQYMRTLMMTPPLEVRGNVVKSSLKFAPGALWDMGTDPNNTVTPAKLETASLTQFPQNYGLIKSQILNLNSGGNDNGISAQSGDPSSSKTPQGVKANEARLGVGDNYIRKQFEDWFQQICETMLNLWFAERSGIQEIELSQDSSQKLEDLVPGATKDNKIRLDYDTATPTIRFRVDAGSSNLKDDQEEIESLKEVIQETTANPLISYYLDQNGYKMNIGEAYRELYERYGIKNISKILTQLPEGQGGQMPYPVIDKPKVTIAYDDLAGNPMAQAGALKDAGIDVPMEVLQQVEAQKQQLEQAKTAPVQPDQNDLSQHPIVKMMEVLNIKFETLGQASQGWILEQMFPGIPVDTTTSTISSNIAASNAAVNVAGLHQTMQDHALKLAQAQATTDQQGATHDLATQQAAYGQKNTEAQMKQTTTVGAK